MEFMGFHIVDMIIVGLILFLSIRGLINGFSKELFNFLALIGGIAVGARTYSMVGEFIAKQNILPKLSLDFQNLIGFIAVFIVIFIFFNILSSLRTKLRSDVPGFFSRFLGYIISIIRYIFIFSLIVFGINNADFLREKFAKQYEKSQLFEPMIQIGEKLLNREKNPQEGMQESKDINQSESNSSMDLNRTLRDHDL